MDKERCYAWLGKEMDGGDGHAEGGRKPRSLESGHRKEGRRRNGRGGKRRMRGGGRMNVDTSMQRTVSDAF